MDTRTEAVLQSLDETAKVESHGHTEADNKIRMYTTLILECVVPY